ncbi:MAG: hypothetical protein M5T61_10955 [Acidimicrobiia bacterium]|nr:hypothetical protein [Acidimicrobiia bacterium]
MTLSRSSRPCVSPCSSARFAVAISALVAALRDLRAATTALTAEAVPLLEEMRAAVRDAGREVDRVERLVTAAGEVTEAVDSAQRLAYKTLASPVIKAMALKAGVSRGARRLREGEISDAPPDVAAHGGSPGAAPGEPPASNGPGAPRDGDAGRPPSWIRARRSRRSRRARRGRGAA